MKSLKNILCAALFCLATAIAPADGWYVCLGSFTSADNAQQFSAVLTKRGLPNAVSVHTVAGKTLYRVLYDKSFERRDEARIFRGGLLDDPRVRLLRLSGLWICEANPDGEKTAAGEVLQKNDEATLPVSEEKPYSLKVRSYKEEHPAQQSSERLRANNIDAYVVKTYDDDAYFSFDVHAGAFATPDESAETANALAALGIEDATLSEYADIKEKMLRYDEVVQ
ncbi:MAG: SPOR domain-containing protein, partial [Treponema sp.]|nr:SPOR domain-containing protein [Treponema sp.]